YANGSLHATVRKVNLANGERIQNRPINGSGQSIKMQLTNSPARRSAHCPPSSTNHCYASWVSKSRLKVNQRERFCSAFSIQVPAHRSAFVCLTLGVANLIARTTSMTRKPRR